MAVVIAGAVILVTSPTVTAFVGACARASSDFRPPMAYDQDLANRVREQLADEHARTEMEMFGGLALLLSGNMAVGVLGDDLMVRVGKENAAEVADLPHVRPLDMSGRPMRAWLLVAPAGVRTDADLRSWVERGVAYAKSLPPKG
jgi:TfoX/Sxy family transcriptional regulator of competence genes